MSTISVWQGGTGLWILDRGVDSVVAGVLAKLDDAKKSPSSGKREWDCRAEGAGAVGEFECEWNPNEKSSD